MFPAAPFGVPRGTEHPVEPAPVDPAPAADTNDARRILFGGHAMRDEGTDSAAHFSVCGNPESWSTVPGPDFIEHQLAHAVRDPNGRAYNRTAFLSERRGMMQAWADCLDRLRTGGELSGSMVAMGSPAKAGDLTPDLAYGYSGA